MSYGPFYNPVASLQVADESEIRNHQTMWCRYVYTTQGSPKSNKSTKVASLQVADESEIRNHQTMWCRYVYTTQGSPKSNKSTKSVPFNTHFHSGVKDGTVVIVNGSIPPSADRFAVNFKCGHGDSDDIAFHFNPRFDHKTVVCNTMQHNNWGTEEVKSQLPFHLCQPFEIRILVTSCNYKVSVNRHHFLEYSHRIPLQRVNNLTIGGTLCLTSVEIQPQGCGIPQQPYPGGHMQNPAYPPQLPGAGCNPPPFNPGLCPPAHYAIPFQTNIHGGLFPSKVIIIRGAVAAHHPQRFNINLNFCGGIAFHFNPRFNENTIVRNSKLNNCWGKEERDLHCGGLCFAPGQSFVIEIICEHHSFRVNVNGNHVCNFNHRVPNLQQINSLQVEGDVVLQHVQV